MLGHPLPYYAGLNPVQSALATPEEIQKYQDEQDAAERKREERAIELYVKYFKTLIDKGVPDGCAADIAKTVLWGAYLAR